MGTAYLVGRITIYLLIGVLGLYWKSYKHRIDKYVLLFVMVGLATDILDYTVFGSNLELYAIYRLVILCILGRIIYQSTANFKLPVVFIAIQTIALLTAFFTEYNFNFIQFDNVFTSEYGWLNTDQSTQLTLLSNLQNIILLFYWIHRFVSSDDNKDQSKYILYAFAFLVNFGLGFILKVFDRLLYNNSEDYFRTSFIVLITAFFIEHILIIIGLKWKQ